MSAKNFTYTLEIDAEIKNLLAKAEQVKKSMAGITANGKMPEMDKQLQAIERSLTKLQEKAATPITSAAAFGSMQKDVAATKVAIEGLSGSVTKLQTASTGEKLQFIDPNMLKTIQAADAALDTFGTATSEASKKTADLVTAEKVLAAANREVEKAQNGVNKSQEKADAAKGRADAAKQEAEAIKKKLEVLQKWQATQKAYDTADANGKKPDKRSAISPDVNYRKDKNAAEGLGIDISTPEKLNAAIQTLTTSLTAQESEVSRLKGQYATAEKSLKNHKDRLTDATNASNSAQLAFDKLNTEFEQNKAKNSQAAFDTLRSSVEKLGIDLSDIPTQYTEQNLDALRAKCDQLKNQGVQGVDASLDTLGQSLRDTGDAADATGNKIQESAQDFKKLDEQAGQTQAFANRIKQFVGVQGAALLMRKALRNAYNTVKELDKAMTEMSVVTDKDIGDYWDELPTYTARANEMGLAIKDVYQADTLFYQQGLKTAEVVALSSETMKMARIAGLDTAEATDRMTAALRGFNMELNETNAQKVADVYSQLAAITASDVDEISSAMTKTASIASNAGMEFETTAAFLSQIIETTRESAETAGTAMKTVIARFQELKKDPAEIGEVDGEIVDANKIETALKSVGVQLRDTGGQFRELDDVFLELSSKWDSLDTNTQRYIATIAAGSRQQSRFIAMMSDYGRTTELVEAANSSAGASNEQFAKTMDSLDAKLNQLKNAWDSFTMGLMDSEILKGAVDLLTQILTALNEFSSWFGEFDGAVKLGLIIAALYLGDKALKTFLATFSTSKSIFASFGAVGKGAVNGVSAAFVKLKTNLSQATMNAVKLNQTTKKGFSKQQTAALQQYNLQLSREQMLDKARYSTKQKLLALEAAGKKNTAEYIALQTHYNNTEGIAAAQSGKRAAAQAALFAAMELTETQQKEAIALNSLGISMDTAAMLASSGYTAAEIAQAAAVKGVSVAEYAKTLATEADTTATGKSALATFILTSAHTLQQKSLKGLIKSWWGSLKAKFADIAATWGQTGANVALQASMWPILVVTLLIVAAIALLVLAIVGIIALIKKLKANSPEGQLKSAEEAAEAAAEAADKAAESYNNLANAFESLSEKYKNLEELTEGTEEWREAVKGVNDEVLALIEEYPELAPLVENENGVMKIDLDSTEAQAVLDKYEAESKRAANASLAAKINVNDKKAAKTSSDLQGKMTGVYIGDSQYIDITQDTLQAVSQAMTSGDIRDNDGDGELDDEIQTWLEANGTTFEAQNAEIFAKQLADTSESLKEFGLELDAAAAQERVYMQEMANNALDLVDETKYSQEQMQQMQNAATSELAQQMNEEAQQKFENSSKEEKTAAKEEVAKSLYGEDATVSGNTITYYDESGEKQTKELTDEEFKEQWAAMEATEAMTKALETVPAKISYVTRALDKLQDGLGQAYKQLLTDSSKATKKQAKALNPTAGSEQEQYLQGVWHHMDSSQKELYGNDYEKFLKEIQGPLEELNKIFDAADAKLGSYVEGLTLNTNFTAEAAEGYMQVIDTIAIGLGDNTDQIASINGYINDIANELSPEDFEKFMSNFNAIELTNLDSWEGFSEVLDSVGLGAITASDSFKNLVADGAAAANAIKKVDLKTFAEDLKSLQSTIANINSGEQGRTFDKETYEKITQNNPSLKGRFQETVSGEFLYLGSSMADLIIAINENTEATRQNNESILIDKINAAEVMNAMANVKFADGSRNMDTSQSEEWNSAEQRDFIASAVQSFSAQNIDISSLGIAGLSENTNIDSLNKATDADVEAIFKALLSVQSSQNQNKTDLETSQGLSSITAQNFSVEQNMAAAVQLQDTDLEGLRERLRIIMSQAIQAGVAEADLTDIATAIEMDDAALQNLDLSSLNNGLLTAIENTKEVEEETEKWISEYDYLHQLNQKITQQQKEKEKLEASYEKLLNSSDVSATAILESQEARLKNLNSQLNLQVAKWAESSKALEQMTDTSGDNAGFAQYVTYNAETGGVEVDYEAANAAFGDNAELGELFDQYVGELYELSDTATDAQEAIEEIEEQTEDIKNEGKEEYSNLVNRIAQGLQDSAQKNIDALQNVNDSITEMNSSIVESIQEQIADQRQARENEKAESDIMDKEARLAYLKQDTSGANALEIAALEKELASDKESYGDSLIDQSLTQMQEANEKAAEQRQQQIDIAQAQLDAYAASGQLMVDAEAILAASLASENRLNTSLNDLSTNLSSDFLGLNSNLSTIDTNFGNSISALGTTWATTQTESDLIQNGLINTTNSTLTGMSSLLTTSGADILRQADGVDTLNSLEKEEWGKQLARDTAAATAYGTINGSIQSERSDVQDATKKVQSATSTIDSKLTAVSNATNGTINDARKQIIEGIVGEDGATLDSVDSDLQELLTPEDYELIKDKLPDYFNKEESFDTMWSSAGFTDTDAALGKKHGEEITDIKEATEAAKQAEANAETARVAREQSVNYNNLLNDSVKISKKQYEEMQASGSISSSKTYDAFSAEYDKQHSGSNKKLMDMTSEDIASMISVASGGTTEPEDEPDVTKNTVYGGIPLSKVATAGFDDKEWAWMDLTIDGYKAVHVQTGGKASNPGSIDREYKTTTGGESATRGVVLYGESGNLWIRGSSNWYTIRPQNENKSDHVTEVNTLKSKAIAFRENYIKDHPNLYAYEKGGLADFTGPAWLDGTKAHPELVLNAQDTQNFIALKDILSEVMKNNTSKSGSSNTQSGDNYFDIEINVESIDSDYDVEQLADKIRNMIYQDATYRNVNVLSNKP